MSVDGYQFEIHQRGPRSVVGKNIILLKTHLSNVFIESHTAAENVNAPWQPEDRFSKLSVTFNTKDENAFLKALAAH